MTGTSSEMGVIQRLPQFESIVGPPLAHPLTGKPVAYQQSYEQATIEHYFTQSKYQSFPQGTVVRPKTFLSRLVYILYFISLIFMPDFFLNMISMKCLTNCYVNS